MYLYGPNKMVCKASVGVDLNVGSVNDNYVNMHADHKQHNNRNIPNASRRLDVSQRLTTSDGRNWRGVCHTGTKVVVLVAQRAGKLRTFRHNYSTFKIQGSRENNKRARSIERSIYRYMRDIRTRYTIYRIALIFRGSLILRISRISNRSRNYFSENFDTSKLSHIGDVKDAHSRNYFNSR